MVRDSENRINIGSVTYRINVQTDTDSGIDNQLEGTHELLSVEGATQGSIEPLNLSRNERNWLRTIIWRVSGF